MSKIYIGITTQNDKENIEQLTSVFDCFDGLAAVDHFSNDGTYELLKSRMKDGFVEQIPYWGQHSHSLNHLLYHPKIEIGSWILLRDSKERVAESFAKNIKAFIGLLETSNINSIYQYSKLLLFKRFAQQYFQSTPHWGFHGARANYIQIENMGWYKNDEEYCYSVRNKNRDQFHFVFHYLKYYLFLDSNHGLLGLENKGDINKLFPARENIRLTFRSKLINNGYSCNIDGVKRLMTEMKDGKADWAKEFFNGEKILNDAYRYYIFEDKLFKDNHDWSDIVKI